MKRRIRRITNFLAFNLLFFALYLNFIHKDKVAYAPVANQSIQTTATVSHTVPVSHPEKYLGTKATGSADVASQQ